MKTRPDSFLGRLALAASPSRPWLVIVASNWWTRVLLAGGARLRSLNGAELGSANFARAYLKGAKLRRANLSYATLNSADLRYADLRDADLRCARLLYASLLGADLSGADLRGAELVDTDLRGADLSGADLRSATLDANLIRAKWSERTRWPDLVGEEMHRRSVPIGNGRYEVQGSGNSGADERVPHAPVS